MAQTETTGKNLNKKLEHMKKNKVSVKYDRDLDHYQLTEQSKLQVAYREFFKALMDEFGVKSPVQLKTAEQRKEFFNRIKKEWPKAKAKIGEHYLRTEIRVMIKEVLNEKTSLDS